MDFGGLLVLGAVWLLFNLLGRARGGPRPRPRTAQNLPQPRPSPQVGRSAPPGDPTQQEGSRLEPRVYDVPREIDEEIARLKLETMGVEIDILTPAQREYLESWTVGT